MARTAIVTGGSSGIGFAVARLLVDAGDTVIIGGREASKLSAAAATLGEPGRVHPVAGDIGEPDTASRLVEAAIAATGRVDLLVNNAGIFSPAPFTEVEAAEFDTFVSVNLRGTWLVTQAVVRQMKAQPSGGSIVNIGTVLNQHAISGFPASAPLVTKGGVQALTVALAAELAADRIRVNMVAPGIIRTPLHNADELDALGGLAVLDRVGEAIEVASAVQWLADAEFVTGHVLNLDGGFVTGRR